MLYSTTRSGRKIAIVGVLALVGCATNPSASVDVYNSLAQRTAARNMKLADGLAASNNGNCLFLSQTSIQAPQGWTESGDIDNAAKSIDAAVTNMGGNAYDIRAYQWVHVEIGTALQVAFGVYLCKPETNAPEVPTRPVT